ncbi:MAG: hypothetical protein ABI563_06425 [Specibacter sp.]
MHVIIRRSLCAAVFAGGLLALGTGAASAADQPIADTTSTVQGGASQDSTAHTAPNRTNGLLGGLVGDVLGNVQVAVPVTVPVNISGNAVGVLGDAVSNGSEAGNPAANVASTATLNNVRAMSSGMQVLGRVAPQQLAQTGSGLWPVYVSVQVLLAGFGLLLLVRRLNYRSDA